MAKFITAKEAAELIPDGATVAVAGLGVSGWAEEIGCAIRDRYKETGHPKNLYLKQGSAMGDHGYGNNFLGWDKQPLPEGMEKPAGVRGTSRLGEAGEGLVTRWTGAHVMSADALNALAAQGKITGNCVPQGVAVNLWREIAAGRPGLLTKVGLGTFIDPRLEGGRMNKETQEDAAELVTFGGEEYLFYKSFPVDVALLRGTVADENGNISEEAREGVMNELRRSFRPEFLNRLDETIFFRPLTKDNLKGIIDIMLDSLKKRLADKSLGLEVTDAAKELIIDRGFDPVYGARPLRRYLQSSLETLVARKILSGDLDADSTITVDVENGELVCK